MVLGIGIDIIEIRRISKAMDNPVFMDKIYTPGEQEYIRTRKTILAPRRVTLLQKKPPRRR